VASVRAGRGAFCTSLHGGKAAKKKTRKWFREHSALFNIISVLIDRNRDLAEPFFELPAGNVVRLRRAEKGADATSLKRDDRRIVFEDSLTILRNARECLQEAGIRFSVVLLPSKEVVFHEWARINDWPIPDEYARNVAPRKELHRLYAEFLDAEGLPYRDTLRPPIAALDAEIQADPTLYPTFDDGHPYAPGYVAYAEAAAELLPLRGDTAAAH